VHQPEHLTQQEHILHSKNTSYTARTHLTQQEHILHSKNTFYTARTHFTQQEHILHSKNTFYTARTHLTQQEHICRLPPVQDTHFVLLEVCRISPWISRGLRFEDRFSCRLSFSEDCLTLKIKMKTKHFSETSVHIYNCTRRSIVYFSTVDCFRFWSLRNHVWRIVETKRNLQIEIKFL
jgi:hypothetical protein